MGIPVLEDCYDRLPGQLICRWTGQRLLVISTTQERIRIRYEDGEVAEELEGRFETFRMGSGGRNHGRRLQFTWERGSLVRASYGRWRRIIFFLLDAVMAHFENEEAGPMSDASFFGGWFNGHWDEGGWYRAIRRTPRRFLCDIAAVPPIPLDMLPAIWRYEPGEGGKHEGVIKVQKTEPFAMLPLSDEAISVAEQVADVPRCVASNGEILFFHKVIPFQGPEYAPGVRHGFATDGFVFTLMDFHGGPAAAPIRREAERQASEALVWEANSSSPSAELHPVFLERLLFAGVDAYTAMRDELDRSRPTMVDPEHGQAAAFFPRWNHQSRAPFRAGFAGIEGFPSMPGNVVEPGVRKTGLATWWKRLFPGT